MATRLILGVAMSITDKQMNSKPTHDHQWFSETAIMKHGSLIGRITPSGERLFYFRYVSSTKKRVTYPIGAYSRQGTNGTLTLLDARQKALELAMLHKSGITDIAEHFQQQEDHRKAQYDAEMARLAKEKAEAEAEILRLHQRMTVRELFEEWMRLEVSRRKDGGAEVRRMFEKDVLPLLGERVVEDIRKGDVMQVVDALAERGVKRMSKLIFSMIRQMFNFAVERDYIEANPTAAINKSKVFGADNQRDRILSADEINMLAQRLPQANLLHTTQAALWIALGTCCRIGEILGTEWKEIDLHKREWTIPAEKSKNAKPHVIYLSDFVLKQFEVIYSINGQTAWCFPNRDQTAAVCSKTVTKQVTDRQKRDEEKVMSGRSKSFDALQLSGGYWTPHDLRRTGASVMTMLGVLPDVADRCMNHLEQNKIKRVYLRYDYAKEMKEAWDKLGEYLQSIVGSAESTPL